MNLIFDACSTINLHNGDMLRTVLSLASFRFTFYMGMIVRGECGNLGTYIDEEEKSGRITILPGKAITPIEFAGLLNRYELGLGETECIVHAERLGLILCTDDKAARNAAKTHLGDSRVLGSVRLIRECVCAGMITAGEAYIAYELTRSRGAFLPDMPASYFEP